MNPSGVLRHHDVRHRDDVRRRDVLLPRLPNREKDSRTTSLLLQKAVVRRELMVFSCITPYADVD